MCVRGLGRATPGQTRREKEGDGGRAVFFRNREGEKIDRRLDGQGTIAPVCVSGFFFLFIFFLFTSFRNVTQKSIVRRGAGVLSTRCQVLFKCAIDFNEQIQATLFSIDFNAKRRLRCILTHVLDAGSWFLVKRLRKRIIP